MHRYRCRLVWLSIFVCCGCEFETPIREYEVARESARVLTSDVLRDQFESVPFRWKVPSGWRKAENDQFSSFAWTAGPESAPARITISDLPGAAGIEPQFIRWQGQLNIPESASAELLKSVEELSLGRTQGRWIEIRGETETILGMIAPWKDKLWVIKYRSPNATADEQKSAFRSFCESLEVG